MFKTFSTALLAAVAVAKGTNDGSSRDNAVSTVLVKTADVELTINSYNADNNGVQELHGDLTAVTPAGKSWFENVVYGFCIGVTDTTWDCVRVEANLNTAKNSKNATSATSFLLSDSYVSKATISALTDLNADTTAPSGEDPTKSWVPVSAKSKKTCTKVAEFSGAELVNCTDLNVHYLRNFETDSATQDAQLKLSEAGAKKKIFGFFQDFQTAPDKGASRITQLAVGAVQSDWVAVHAAHKTAVEAAAAEAAKKGGSGDSSGAYSMAAFSAIAASAYMLF